MYCPSCGSENAQGLRYCKRCGANLDSNTGAPKKFPLALTLAFLALIGFVLSVGLVAPFAAISETAGRGVSVDSLMPILVIIPLVAFGVIWLLVWLLLRLIKIYQQSGGPTQIKEDKQASPRDYMPARIAAPPESMGSVTEHTTRNFDSIENRAATRESVRDTK